MPTYEYECTKCAKTFELFQSITAKPVRRIKTRCSKCKNSAPVKRLIGTGAALLFKGDGFYETDYRSDGYKKAAKAESESSSKDGKADTKTKTQSDNKSSDKKTTTGKNATSDTGASAKPKKGTK